MGGQTFVSLRVGVGLGCGAVQNKACGKGYNQYMQCLGRCQVSFCAFDDLVVKMTGRSMPWWCQKWAVKPMYLFELELALVSDAGRCKTELAVSSAHDWRKL